MTSIHVDDPSSGAALPDLPPLAIGVLAAGTLDLMQQAVDLPQPAALFIYDHQAISVQFASERASLKAVARWAMRFGGAVISEPHQGDDGPETWCRLKFDYYGIAVTAYAHVPAGTATT